MFVRRVNGKKNWQMLFNAGKSKVVHFGFYSAHNARIASAVLAAAIPSVLSVRLSVRHTPVLCQNDGT